MWSPLEISLSLISWAVLEAELQHNFSPTLKPGADLLSPCISRLQAASRDMMCNLRLSQGQSSGEGKRQRAISSPQSQQLGAPAGKWHLGGGCLTPAVGRIWVFFPGKFPSPTQSQTVEMGPHNSVCQKHPGSQPSQDAK